MVVYPTWTQQRAIQITTFIYGRNVVADESPETWERIHLADEALR